MVRKSLRSADLATNEFHHCDKLKKLKFGSKKESRRVVLKIRFL